MKVAAVQLEVTIGDVARNLAECERLARAAAAEGASLVALPEFFTTGACFDPALADAAVAPDGPATEMLARVAREEEIYLGGSFLCRDPDGEVRNAFLLASPAGAILGRHDKDLPTMWENSFYVGGSDDGLIEAGEFVAGAAVCWEFMRSQTARRLRGRVDVVVGGSNWWSIPRWRPRALTDGMEWRNLALTRRAPAVFGRFVGAPVVHAAMCGEIECAMPPLGPHYSGRLEGGALIADATGRVLTERAVDAGSGIVVAEIEVGRTPPRDEIPRRYWLHRRQAIAVVAWHAQRIHGRRWYARHVRGRPPLELDVPTRASA